VIVTPRLAPPTPAQRATWARGALRVEGLLDEALAREAHEHLGRVPWEVEVGAPPDPPWLAWRCAFAPEADCEHLLCALGRSLLGPVRAWAEDLTGVALAPPPDELVTATRLEKGSHVDLRDEGGRGRAVLVVLGLTPESWPPELGGHLERTDDQGAVLERLAPGWRTLDLVDVRHPGAWLSVPLLRAHREARALASAFVLA
jgi:hypothetical protein